MRPCGATRAGTQAPPLPNTIIFFHASHTNKTTIYAQSIQTTSTIPHAIHPNETVGANIRAQFSQAKCVGAAPACPPERSHSGVSMPKIHALCAGNLTMDAPLWSDAGGHTGTAPTNLHQTTRCSITSSHCTFDNPRQPRGVSIPRRIANSIAPNHAVRHYPIGVILSIAQGWQV